MSQADDVFDDYNRTAYCSSETTAYHCMTAEFVSHCYSRTAYCSNETTAYHCMTAQSRADRLTNNIELYSEVARRWRPKVNPAVIEPSVLLHQVRELQPLHWTPHQQQSSSSQLVSVRPVLSPSQRWPPTIHTTHRTDENWLHGYILNNNWVLSYCFYDHICIRLIRRSWLKCDLVYG